MSQAISSTEQRSTEQPLKVKIAGMDCGSCAMTIENSMRQLSGVQSATVSFTTESMEVDGDVSLEDIAMWLKSLGYRLAVEEPTAEPAPVEARGAMGVSCGARGHCAGRCLSRARSSWACCSCAGCRQWRASNR